MSAGAYVITTCLGACKASGGSYPTPPSNFNLALNLSDPANSALNSNGGYIYTSNGVIVARTNTGAYIAVSEYCTHQGSAVVYQASSNNFYCPSHGSVFAAGGSVSSGPATTALKQYATSLVSNVLHVSG